MDASGAESVGIGIVVAGDLGTLRQAEPSSSCLLNLAHIPLACPKALPPPAAVRSERVDRVSYRDAKPDTQRFTFSDLRRMKTV